MDLTSEAAAMGHNLFAYLLAKSLRLRFAGRRGVMRTGKPMAAKCRLKSEIGGTTVVGD